MLKLILFGKYAEEGKDEFYNNVEWVYSAKFNIAWNT